MARAGRPGGLLGVGIDGRATQAAGRAQDRHDPVRRPRRLVAARPPLDPEALRDLLARYFGEHDVVERHGGIVEKYIGDAIMAVFGVPTVHEDDALRAVRAAVEMRETLAILNRELERAGASAWPTASASTPAR